MGVSMKPGETTQETDASGLSGHAARETSVTSSPLIPPPPVIDSADGRVSRYTALQAALIYVVVRKRVRKVSTPMIISGLLMIIGGIMIGVYVFSAYAQIGHALQTPATPSGVAFSPSWAFLLIPGLLMLLGLGLFSLGIVLRYLPPYAGLTVVEVMALVGVCIQVPIILLVYVGKISDGMLWKVSTPAGAVLVVLLGGLLVLAVVVSMLQVPIILRRMRRNTGYRPVLSAPPTPEMTATAQAILMRLVKGLSAGPDDMIEFRLNPLYGSGFLGRGLVRDDLLILGTIMGGALKRYVEQVFFLSPGSRFIEVKGEQPPQRIQQATFYLEDMRVRGTIEPAMLQRYEAWGTRKTAAVTLPE
jgi:hypothetical protein